MNSPLHTLCVDSVRQQRSGRRYMEKVAIRNWLASTFGRGSQWGTNRLMKNVGDLSDAGTLSKLRGMDIDIDHLADSGSVRSLSADRPSKWGPAPDGGSSGGAPARTGAADVGDAPTKPVSDDVGDAAAPSNRGRNAAMVAAGLGIPGAAIGGAAYGQYQGRQQAKRDKMLAFGGGMAAGVAAPRVISGMNQYLGRMVQPQRRPRQQGMYPGGFR